ncbi:MAG: SH3 domain-containing protein, partial [Lachnospiraceae bacterium]|nr:SH3 domain-containing protein [Lachnospiraceae bacterium]
MRFKRLICTLLAVTLLLLSVGCKNNNSDVPSTNAETNNSNAFGTVTGNETTTEAPSPTDEPSSQPTEEPTTETPETIPTAGQTEAPTEESTEERFVYTFEPRNDTVYTTDNLNIRREPYNDAEIVTVAKKGTQLKRVGWQDYWCQVEYNGEILYAATKYLTTTAPAAP